MNATIIVPVYNEVQAVDSELKLLFAIDSINDYEIIIVDDGSTDGTTAKLRDLCDQAGHDHVVLLHHDQNIGYGAALKTGIVNASTEHIVITDADNSYPNERIPELYEIYKSEVTDMVVGARTAKDAAIPLARRFPKWCLNKLANYLTRTKIPDLNSGLRICRRDVILENLNLICDGFSFTTTLTLIMLCNSYKVKYIPIAYHTRSGRSKIRPIKDTLNFIYLVCSTVLYFKPLRVFIPPGVLLLFLSLCIATYQAVFMRNITTVSLMLLQSSFYVLTLGLLADLISKSRPVNHSRHIHNNDSSKQKHTT
jgi:glycosyltransferase involved in cell wall biosynthesis